MILQVLRSLHQRIRTTHPDAMPNSGYSKREIRWLLDLDHNGRLLSVIPLESESSAERPSRRTRGIPHMVPNPDQSGKRGVKLKPGLFADTAEYVLGKASPDRADKAGRIAQAHCLFREAVAKCAETTDLPEAQAVVKFYEKPENLTDPRLESIGGGDWVAFRVDGDWLVDKPVVRDYWLRIQTPDGKRGTCMVCRTQDVVLVGRHPVPLKGVVGGQPSGVLLISANVNVFESYGLEESRIAPMCTPCAEQIHHVINYLLSSKHNHFRVGGVDFCFWTRDYADTGFVVNLLDLPDDAIVQHLFQSVFGSEKPATVDHDWFYCFGLSGSGGRAVLRTWIDASLPSVQFNLARYFRAQQVVGGKTRFLKLFSLAGALRGAGKNSADLPTWVPIALIRFALGGEPVPRILLSKAVQRCIVGGKSGQGRVHVTHHHAALIKLCLAALKFPYQQSIPEEWMVKLDETCEEPAYLYGRLFFELEQIQWDAVGVVNVERAFGTAVSSPLTALPRLLTRAKQAHLPKLRRDEPAKFTHHERTLNAILGRLGVEHAFKVRLNDQEQGMFVLGYWHQRAEHWERIQQAKDAKAAQAKAQSVESH